MHLGMVIPQSGPSGIFGPSCAASAQLAVEEINQRGGILGREVTVTTIDGGAPVEQVAAAVSTHLGPSCGSIPRFDAVVGWHTSAVRRRLVRVLRGEIPYVYTAVYEGGEGARGTFMTGEVPDAALLPAFEWLSQQLGARRWVVVGSDYIWPRATAATVTAHLNADSSPTQVQSQIFCPLGTSEFGDVLDHIEASGATAVLVLLLGEDAVQFNRAFGARGLDGRCVRLSSLMDENMLLGSGDGGTRNLYSVSGYFESLATPYSLDFEQRYVRRFGVAAPPLTSPGESCFEGVTLLDELIRRAGSTHPRAIEWAAGESPVYTSPRGEVRFSARHLRQAMYVAQADGLEFDILAQVGDPSTAA
ncbi:substrate-binding domain-containing protein [Gordonia sp. Z-3]|uniref:Substrate-binding domain-containing protein n=1 Tax=Gordonia aquimaris TaxID=2984863 RepID=A0A9X3D596_9ACTN|nr:MULTISPECIES: substrate-binding domain-containing protein [Gordonia]MCX2964036.1 substrate-binding domain-containing protein [Gordonia aquimaris]MED5803728.1 substrate-binding domain-containing protein [Gordonia sp. Z-3]